VLLNKNKKRANQNSCRNGRSWKPGLISLFYLHCAMRSGVDVVLDSVGADNGANKILHIVEIPSVGALPLRSGVREVKSGRSLEGVDEIIVGREVAAAQNLRIYFFIRIYLLETLGRVQHLIFKSVAKS